jgi:hypothetical protein
MSAPWNTCQAQKLFIYYWNCMGWGSFSLQEIRNELVALSNKCDEAKIS